MYKDITTWTTRYYLPVPNLVWTITTAFQWVFFCSCLPPENRRYTSQSAISTMLVRLYSFLVRHPSTASLHGLGFPPSLIFLHSQFYSLSSGHTILPTCSLLPGILSQPGLVQLAPSCHSYFSFLAVGFLIDS